jgi:hypothetical protein
MNAKKKFNISDAYFCFWGNIMPIFEKKIEKCLSHFNSDFGLVVNFFSSF